MDCFWFIIVHFSFPCNTKCIVVSVTLTAFLFYSLFSPMFTYIKSLTQHLPSLPSLPSCLCLLLFLSLWLHMVQSCMSEQQTARRQQSARAGSCASPNYPFNKAWASSTKIFLYSSLQHSFFSPLSLSDLCPATSSLPLLGWPAQAYREDCGSLRHLGQLGEFFLFSFLASHLTAPPSLLFLLLLLLFILWVVRFYSATWQMSFPSIKSRRHDWQVRSQRTDKPGMSRDLTGIEGVSGKELGLF